MFTVSICVGVASLAWPLSWDEGIFAWIGDVVARGGTPYVDAWDVKGPLAYFGYALAEIVFGRMALGVRAIDLLLTVTGCAGVFYMLNPMMSKRAACLSALILFTSVLGEGYNVNGQPDLWASWLITMAVAMVWNRASFTRSAAGAALIGASMLIKPVYAAFLVLLWFPVFANGVPGWRKSASMAATMAAGCAAPIILCIGWFWSRGALREFFDSYILFNLEANGTSHITLGIVASAAIGFLTERQQLLIAVPFCCVGLWFALSGQREGPQLSRMRLLVTWIVIAVFLVALQNRWFAYHWAPWFPAVTMAASLGFHRIWIASETRSDLAQYARLLVSVTIAMIACGISSAPIKSALRTFKFVTHRITAEEFESGFTNFPGDYTLTDIRLAADFVRDNTATEDRVLVWQELNVNVLTGRKTPGRFAFYTPIEGRPGEVTSGRMATNRAEMFRTLAQHPPIYVLVEPAAWRGGNPNALGHLPSRFPELMRWIEQNYEPQKDVGRFLVFKIRS